MGDGRYTQCFEFADLGWIILKLWQRSQVFNMIYQLNGPTKLSHVNGKKNKQSQTQARYKSPFKHLPKTGGLEIQLQFVKGPVASFLHQNQLTRISNTAKIARAVISNLSWIQTISPPNFLSCTVLSVYKLSVIHVITSRAKITDRCTRKQAHILSARMVIVIIISIIY